jgi:hypothetical protein
MTRRISLTAAAGIAALALTASAAFAQVPPERRGLSDFGLSASTPITVRPGVGRWGQPNLVSSYRDTSERAAPQAGTAYVATVSSGSGIEWPQIGVGFIMGILLAFGLVLGLRYTRVRPLAH